MNYWLFLVDWMSRRKLLTATVFIRRSPIYRHHPAHLNMSRCPGAPQRMGNEEVSFRSVGNFCCKIETTLASASAPDAAAASSLIRVKVCHNSAELFGESENIGARVGGELYIVFNFRFSVQFPTRYRPPAMKTLWLWFIYLWVIICRHSCPCHSHPVESVAMKRRKLWSLLRKCRKNR